MALKDIVLKLVIDGKESLVTLDKLDNKTGKLTKTVKGVASSLGLAFGSYQIIGWMKESIALAQRENEVIGKLNATLESTGYAAGLSSKELVDMAKNLEEFNRFKFDDKDIIDAEGMLLTFKKINKEIFPEALQLSMDLSARFNQDLNSSIKQIGKALEDPIRGMTALRKAGVQFDETQEKQIKKFIEVNDLMSAQKIILAELTTQVSGAARRSVDDYTYAWGKVTDALEDATIAAGHFFQSIGIGLYEVGNYIGSVIKTGSFAGGLYDYNNRKAQERFEKYKGAILNTYDQKKLDSPLDFGDDDKIDKAKKEADEFYKHLQKLEEDYLKWEKGNNDLRYWTAKMDNNAGVAAKNQRIKYFNDNMNGAVNVPEKTGAEYIDEDLNQIAASAQFFGNEVAGIFDNTWDTIISGSFSAADIMNNLFKSLLDSIGDYISNAIFKEASGSFVDSLFGMIPLLAEGGIVTKPTLSVIGESGPEAVVPLDRFNMGGREIRVVVEGALKGDTIYLANKRATINRNKNQS